MHVSTTRHPFIKMSNKIIDFRAYIYIYNANIERSYDTLIQWDDNKTTTVFGHFYVLPERKALVVLLSFYWNKMSQLRFIFVFCL